MAYSTKINLCSGKVEQTSGSALILSGDTCIAASGSISYSTHPASFTDLELVDKCYVDTSAGIIDGANGLSRVDNNIVLGGALTGTTTINGAETLRINITNFNVTGITNLTGAANITGAIDGNSTLDILGATALHSTLDVTGATTLVGKASYTTDLSPFTARQIPDAAWVTGQTSSSGVQTANNGLTKDGTNVRLGGALTGNTTVSGAYTMAFTNTTFNVTATNIGLTGTVGVTGALNVSSNIDGNGTLDILGATALHSTLDVTGATTLTTLDASSNVDINGTLDVLGVTDLRAAVNITGATAIGGALTLSSVDTGSVATDSVMVVTTGGVVKKIAADTLEEDNNRYGIEVINTNVTASTSGYTILVSGATAITLTLPAILVDGQAYKIKDASGNALTNNITVAGGGKNIDGSSDALINTNYGALELVYSSTLDAWFSLAFIN